MDPSLFKVSELGKLVLSSGLLHSSWSKISMIHDQTSYRNKDSALKIEIFTEGNLTFVVFAAPPTCENDSAPTHLHGSENPNPFHFLCSEKISSFSVHTRTFQLFADACNRDLPNRKSELLELLEDKKPVIMTGAGLGGSVASLFTLWLVESINPKLQRPSPLCITFGSPLIGDASLQEILKNSVRSSWFLHVADVAQPVITGENDFFKPFGTFLICRDSECICIDDHEEVTKSLTGDLVAWRDYGEILQRLDQSSGVMSDDHAIKKMDERMEIDKVKKLNQIKIAMIHIEWYKKKIKVEKIGFYDHFKTQLFFVYEYHRKELNSYWDEMVEEVEKKPQSDKSYLKTGWLLSGNNYRRLLEPLDIAEYYKEYLPGRPHYRSVRPHRYVMLEKWFKDEKIKAVRSETSDLSDLLTFDSCFWAEVEEAMSVIRELKTLGDMTDEALTGKLERFKDYVWGLIGKREVSPEIFLEKSTFMEWWKEYKEIKGREGFYSSPFTEFMNTNKYQSYGQQQVTSN